MKYSEGTFGRVFALRLEHGEVVHEVIEKFATEKKIKAGGLIAVGGSDKDSRIVVGPEDGNARPVNPMEYILDNVHEVAGTGTLFLDDTGKPMLHMHMACGRDNYTVTGCIRNGVVVWQILEIIIFEIKGISSIRKFNENLGFYTLEP
jgi:predicted DNA-binding protein with PD1-like motif